MTLKWKFKNIKSNIVECSKKLPLKVKVVALDNSRSSNRYYFNDFVKEDFFDYFHAGENIGFGAGHNWVAKKFTNTKYYLFLNPDICFDGEILKELFSRLEVKKNISMCAPRILNADRSIQYVHRKLPSFFLLFAHRFLKSLSFDKYKLKAEYSHDVFKARLCFRLFYVSAGGRFS